MQNRKGEVINYGIEAEAFRAAARPNRKGGSVQPQGVLRRNAGRRAHRTGLLCGIVFAGHRGAQGRFYAVSGVSCQPAEQCLRRRICRICVDHGKRTYFEVAVITLIANARYLLMSCALAQRFAPETPFWHRLLIGYDVTDELFGITIAAGNLNPYYTYGAILLAAPAWASGTALGIIAGNLLPLRVVSALSVALYGMFLAIIIPPARKDRIVAVLVVISFALSFLCSYLPGISALSEGTRTILLTVAISGAAAVLFPVRQEENEDDA